MIWMRVSCLQSGLNLQKFSTNVYDRCNAVTLDHVSADFRKIKTPWEVFFVIFENSS